MVMSILAWVSQKASLKPKLLWITLYGELSPGRTESGRQGRSGGWPELVTAWPLNLVAPSSKRPDGWRRLGTIPLGGRGGKSASTSCPTLPTSPLPPHRNFWIVNMGAERCHGLQHQERCPSAGGSGIRIALSGWTCRKPAGAQRTAENEGPQPQDRGGPDICNVAKQVSDTMSVSLRFCFSHRVC